MISSFKKIRENKLIDASDNVVVFMAVYIILIYFFSVNIPKNQIMIKNHRVSKLIINLITVI